MYRFVNLDNGLRAAFGSSEGNVSYIGILVNAGSREDPYELDGLAHFVEHTVFKGTPSRNSLQVSNRMELIGGDLNAYTTKEETMIYTAAPSGYEQRAMELLADLVANAWFPEQDIDLERGVVLEEIHSYDDNPSYSVFDGFDELFYKGNSLAHNILGYQDTVSRITGDDCRRYLARWFAPGNMVLYCVTPTDTGKCERLVNKYFGGLSRSASPHDRIAPVMNPAFDRTYQKDNHQANVVMGWPVFDYRDPRRYALYLLSNLLGGSAMNSRLNRELRERRGLVYMVESSITSYSDAGLFQIFYATEPAKVERCRKIVMHELDRLAQGPLSKRSFCNARRQLCGQLSVSGENRENRAMNMAKSILRYGEIRDHLFTTQKIMETTPEDLMEVARFILSGQPSRLIIE